MMFIAPVFDGTFDRTDPADASRFQRMIEELKVKVKMENLGQGFLIHRWVDSSHIHVLIFDDTIEGRGEVERLKGEGYEVGPFLGSPKSGLADLVERVRQKTARLDPDTTT